MAIKKLFRVTLIITCILWSIVITMFLGHISHTRKEFNLTDFNHAMKNEFNAGVTFYKDKNLYQLLKVVWPPRAQPGDPGYGGAGFTINRSQLTEREKIIYDNGLKNFHVNIIASEKVPLRRNINLNMPECKNLSYDTTALPTAGIVLIFSNELWSSLMRTVFSILDAGPEHLISEIILVDDASEKDHLGKPLEDYIMIFAGKVKLVRLPERKGLMVARNVGSQHVTGEVVIFLDSHCEVSSGWLEPLLHRIKQDESVVAIPLIDILKWDTFEYDFGPRSVSYLCGFEFRMEFNWIDIPPVDGIKRKNLVDPIPSPAHLGCCLATTKRNFERLGGYDPGLEIWGCENLELSFKTWMCGGRMEVIPCSHIGHMYRNSFPYKLASKPRVIERNCLRVAEVWMDEYKVFYHDRVLDSKNPLDFGDVSARKALREKLKCRSFDWYIKEIYPAMYIPVNTTAIGNIANVQYPNLCLCKQVRSRETEAPTAEICDHFYEPQYFYLTKEKQIRRDSHCLSYNVKNRHFVSEKCTHNPGTWTYSKDNLIMFEDSNLCIALFKPSSIDMTTCNSSDTSQQWNWPRKSIILH